MSHPTSDAGASARDDRRTRRRAPTSPTRVEDVPEYRQLTLQRKIVGALGIRNPYFRPIDYHAEGAATIAGRVYADYSTYDYLDLNHAPAVKAAAQAAIDRFGTSAGASRIAGGERPPHRALEKALADFLGYPDCLAFVSGYLTNTTLIPHLFGKNDLVLFDALSHNSLAIGVVNSGAGRFMFPHNDLEALDRYLTEHRDRYKRALIVTEGLFGMDGTVPDLPGFIRLKKRHRCFLMVDEAHSLGVLGAGGRGVTEHFGVDPDEIDLAMGTLSKTLCGCGGYVCGGGELIDYLRYTTPGFLYSVGMSPPVAAAARAALEILAREPERVSRLRALSRYFMEGVRARDLDTGGAVGQGVVPVYVGNSMVAALATDRLFSAGVNVLPVIHPVVPEGAARLRFFLSAGHQKPQLDETLSLLREAVDAARIEAEKMVEGDEGRKAENGIE